MGLGASTQQKFSQFLKLAFFRSPNYQAGVSGWTINQDGSAEFNNLTIRGTFLGADFIINSSGAFFYTGVPALGNPPIIAVTTAGTDPFGNAVTANAVSISAGALLALAGLLATSSVLTSAVAGDTSARWNVNADGTLSWGPGNAPADTDLYRGAAGLLQTDNRLQVLGAGANALAVANGITTHTLSGGGTVPTVAAGAGAGVGASISGQAGHDLAGSFTLTTAGTPAAGTIATVTFGTGLGAAPVVVLVTVQDTTAGSLANITTVYADTLATTGFSIHDTAALTTAHTYRVQYMVVAS